MKSSHKLILAVCKTLMALSASVFVIATILLSVVLEPNNIKKWVNNSSLYDVSAQEIQAQLQQNFSGDAAKSPIVAVALERTITAELLKKTAERGIDGSFTWLDGNASEPEFALNEAEIRSNLANQVVVGLRDRAQKLPACSLQNPPITSDIFTINCIPPGTDLAQQLAQVRAEITRISDTNITNGAGLTEQGSSNSAIQSGQDIVSQLRSFRQTYQWLKLAPILATILFIVSSAVTLLLIKPKYRFMRTLAIVLIPQGILYIIAGWLTPRAVQSSSDAILAQTATTPFAESVQRITLAATEAISGSFTRAGLIIGAAGAVLLFVYIIVNRKLKPVGESSKQPPEPNSSTPSSS